MPGRASAFRRQVVFRIGAEEWPLLEAAAEREGSLQAGILAALRAFVPATEAKTPDEEPVREEGSKAGPAAAPPGPRGEAAKARRQRERSRATPQAKPTGEKPIHASEAAALLGLKTGTVKGYIRSGRLPGSYEYGPNGGWFTSRAAVARYGRGRG